MLQLALEVSTRDIIVAGSGRDVVTQLIPGSTVEMHDADHSASSNVGSCISEG